MPDFGNPFSGLKSDHKLDEQELIRALRFVLSAEYEAVQLYTQLADSIDNEDVKKVLKSVADEELVHAGEFMALVKKLQPTEEKLLEQGESETENLLRQVVKKAHGKSFRCSSQKNRPSNARDVDITELGMPIKIKQPETTAYETSARGDIGEGGIRLKEEWIDTKIKAIHKDPSDPGIETEDSIRDGSHMIDEFALKNLYFVGHTLYAIQN